jgi:hypothetical protein
MSAMSWLRFRIDVGARAPSIKASQSHLQEGQSHPVSGWGKVIPPAYAGGTDLHFETRLLI